MVLPEGIFSDGALRGEARDSPHSDFNPREELLAAHVPHTGNGKCLLLGLVIPVTELFAHHHVRPSAPVL